jgi:hypothetical protein
MEMARDNQDENAGVKRGGDVQPKSGGGEVFLVQKRRRRRLEFTRRRPGFDTGGKRDPRPARVERGGGSARADQ